MRYHSREPTFVRRLLARLEYRAQPALEPRPPSFRIRAGKPGQNNLEVPDIGGSRGSGESALASDQLSKLPEAACRKIIPRFLPTARQPRSPRTLVKLTREI